MRFLLRLLLILLITWLTGAFLPQWPLWPMVAGAFGVGLLLSQRHRRSMFIRKKPPKAYAFWAGFLAVVIVWGWTLWQMDSANESLLSDRMAALLSQGSGGIQGIHLLLLTVLLGGLASGLGAMTGNLLGEAIKS